MICLMQTVNPSTSERANAPVRSRPDDFKPPRSRPTSAGTNEGFAFDSPSPGPPLPSALPPDDVASGWVREASISVSESLGLGYPARGVGSGDGAAGEGLEFTLGNLVVQRDFIGVDRQGWRRVGVKGSR